MGDFTKINSSLGKRFHNPDYAYDEACDIHVRITISAAKLSRVIGLDRLLSYVQAS